MIELGMTSDQVLAQVGYQPYRTEIIGKDDNGQIVRWFYLRYNLLFKRTDIDGILAYRVTEIDYKSARKHGSS